MQQPVYRETSPRSQTARFFIDEQPLLLYCPVGLVYGEMENLCPYRHFLCRSPFPRFDLPAYLPETRTTIMSGASNWLPGMACSNAVPVTSNCAVWWIFSNKACYNSSRAKDGHQYSLWMEPRSSWN